MSQNITPGRLLPISRTFDESRLFSLKSLERYTARPDDPAVKLAYLQAHVAMEHLVTTQGHDIVIRIIKTQGESDSMDAAFRSAGMNYDTFDNSVREKLTQLLKEPA